MLSKIAAPKVEVRDTPIAFRFQPLSPASKARGRPPGLGVRLARSTPRASDAPVPTQRALGPQTSCSVEPARPDATLGPASSRMPAGVPAASPATRLPAFLAAATSVGARLGAGWPTALTLGLAAALACSVGLRVKRSLQQLDAEVMWPRPVEGGPSPYHRRQAINTLSTFACLVCFFLL